MNMVGKPHLLLASASPRRRELLELLGFTFEVVPSDVDERCNQGEMPESFALRLATEKAMAVRYENLHGRLVIAADTIVYSDNEILGKPKNSTEAKKMLRKLRGRSHVVLTAIALRNGLGEQIFEDVCNTEVRLRDFTDDEIDSYVASGDPLDKSGAYGIQNGTFRPAIPVHGCLANVIGLPLCHLVRTLRILKIHTQVDVPRLCQMHLCYECTVYEDILDY